MGFWKDYFINNNGIDRSSFEELFVCSECFDDAGLIEFLRKEARSNRCDYCGASASLDIAASVADLVRYMEECLFQDYGDAVDNLPYESAEGGYQGLHWNTAELLSQQVGLSLPKDVKDRLFFDICRALGDRAWCESNPFGLNQREVLDFSWREFCEVVKHRSRFLFIKEKGDGEILKPDEMLDAIGEFCRSAELLKILPSTTHLFRAREEQNAEGWSWPAPQFPASYK